MPVQKVSRSISRSRRQPGTRGLALSRNRAEGVLLLALLSLLIFPSPIRAAGFGSSFLKSNDVIAFVGGEDVVTLQQLGYVELPLARETVAKNLRFRNLGWEGDTVFDQRRDLNFPSWEQTLSKIGATVVVAQFGQAESLRGPGALPQFNRAAADFLGRLAGTNRQMVVLAPTFFEKSPGSLPDLTTNNATLQLYSDELKRLCLVQRWLFVDPARESSSRRLTRDGLHLNAQGHWSLAARLHVALGAAKTSSSLGFAPASGQFSNRTAEQLRQAIIAKNQLWFDYWRPQNWAFLAGDRTEQPSSRDHRNPKVRWFPNELEQFLPLIEAKEREVMRLAEELARGK